jgi:putative alpha-1,2-mannosidase
MGFYPVTPVSDQYVLGAPLFKKITVSLNNGKQIVINAPGNDAAHRYVKSFKLNGAEWPKNWISHKTLVQGSTIEFGMSSVADKKRGTADSAVPYSFSAKDSQ